MATLLHLVGSPTGEFHAELSRLYAVGCLDALETETAYHSHLAYVSPDGRWRFPAALDTLSLDEAPAVPLAEAIRIICALGIDAVVPQMFCRAGMTSYRALFEVLGLPYLGNRPEVMAMGADKAVARAVVAAAGVAVPPGEVLRAGEPSGLPLPVVVKPVDADNSVGVSLARTRVDYESAVAVAWSISDAALVESYVELGREVRCGIIVRDGELICLPLEEYAVNPQTKPIRTGEDKLARTADGELYLVAKDPARAWIVVDDDELTERVWALARRCHVALGCRHYSLFDFRIDPDGVPWFLEAGLYCSYAPGSVLSVMAAAAGIGVADLVAMGLHELQREGALCSTTVH
jgi:D-alanine-D-alanine ligase